MPQVKEPILKKLIKEALKEAELSVGSDNTKFGIKLLVSNPQSETKQGIRLQLTPKEGFLEPEQKGELSSAIMQKFNDSLKQFNLQISLDTDTSDPEAMGFFIPLPQLKNMIIKAIGGKTEDEPQRPSPLPQPNLDNKEDDENEIAEAMSDMTGLGLKRSGYKQEEGGELTLKELYEKLSTGYELLVDVFKDIYDSDYKFKSYYENNEETITQTMGIIAMMKDDVEDRLEQEEPVGPDKGIDELKKVIKTQLNEMRVRDLKEISGVVIKEDFYNFINAGNNVLRTLEERAPHLNGKKYLEYLVKHNIM
tara:strand:+ start:818 stop:1741 length:924 start_codon:yes stop_codon:yes gene_type:complete